MYKTKNKRTRKVFLSISLIANLGLLFFFKYFNFFSHSFTNIFERFNIFIELPVFDYLLPVGISFYTFQTLSYTIDIYNKKREPEYHFGKFAVFVSFFPQLVAGPIERSTHLIPELNKRVLFNYENIKNGLLLMVWGLFKKVVIADRLAEYVNVVYNNQSDYGGLQDLIATFFFTFQIYCDFSGYSDIAIGTALVLGIDLMVNFRRPYLSKSIKEFWKRWHISLSTWFQDYVYIPLGGNRVLKWRWYYNLFITFLVSGLWHGANWTFVIWGALHGAYSVIATINKDFRERFMRFFVKKNSLAHNFIQVSTTFILVVFAWIFFRANNVNDAFIVIKKIFSPSTWHGDINLFKFKIDFVIAFLSIFLLLFYEVFEENYNLTNKIKGGARFIKLTLLVVIIFSIFVLGKWEEVDFLYFQF